MSQVGSAGSEIPTPESPLDKVRRARRKLAQSKFLDLEVPGYEGELWIRYQSPGEDDLVEVEERGSTAPEKALDLLIKAAVGLYTPIDDDRGQDAEDDELLEPLKDADGNHLTLTADLGKTLGFEADTARDAVRALFSPEGVQAAAFMSHGARVIAWSQGDMTAIDKALLGK